MAVSAGAEVDGSGWILNLDQPGFSRFLLWCTIETHVNDVSVDIAGRQQSDGNRMRVIAVV